MQNLNKNETEEFLLQFKLENSQKWLSLSEEVLEFSEITLQELRKIQEKTNKLLDL